MAQSGNVKINVEVVQGQFAEAADKIVAGLGELGNALDTVRQTNRVTQEVGAQERRWGLQEWPDGTGPGTQPIEALAGWVYADATELADVARRECDAQEAGGGTTWWAILLEEALEAAAERPELDNEDLDKELTQVAAVAVSWLKHRARRRATAESAETTVTRCRCGAPFRLSHDCQAAPEDQVADHDFLPVTGAPDDDECTFRNDGTDLTYCGQPRGEHR